MTMCIPSLLTILIFSLAVIIHVTPNAALVNPPLQGLRSHWLTNYHHNQNELLKNWVEHKRMSGSLGSRSLPSSFNILNAPYSFKGCVDPSEPFQCPKSERCIALQFICDGNPGDCPGNLDENEETCIAAKRPAKENIEKFFHAEYTLHGSKLFTFLFGDKLSKSIDENNTFWFDTIASAFSVAKNIRSFAEKTRMSSDDVVHFQKVIELIHDGRLEELPMFVQEAVNQGLASLIGKLYESGFMEN